MWAQCQGMLDYVVAVLLVWGSGVPPVLCRQIDSLNVKSRLTPNLRSVYVVMVVSIRCPWPLLAPKSQPPAATLASKLS